MMRKLWHSVKYKWVALMLLCWLLPLILMTLMNAYYLGSDRLESRFLKEVDRLKFDGFRTVSRLDAAVKSSRDASYDGVLLKLWDAYTQGSLEKRDLLSEGTLYLRETYSRSDEVKMAVLWYRQDPVTLDCNTYNTGDGATYLDVVRYWDQDHAAIYALTETLDTKIAFFRHDNRLYLVRNLYDTHYQNRATLVLLLNQEFCFQDFYGFPDGTSITLQLGDAEILFRGEPVTAQETAMEKLGGAAGYRWHNNMLYIYHTVPGRDYTLTAQVRFDDSAAFMLFHGYHELIMFMLLCLIPLLGVLLLMFRRSVTRPIQSLMQGAREIEEGHLGYQLEGDLGSTEFQYLAESFNSMSRQLKYQFQHIYEEELALRDAKIKALQSHINPHFMNNTLEIINWEARLSGNEKISEMIEALGTLMDAGMDRKMKPIIPLSQEMVYVNAYLHITKERLGNRLTIINEFPDEILDCPVPRLILQPVIENAIEHGVVRKGSGTVILLGHREGDYLYLEIVNESVLTQSDRDKVQKLLANDYDPISEPSGNLGIANVNQRLRILYGDPCGLSVFQLDDQHVMSRLVILQKEQ